MSYFMAKVDFRKSDQTKGKHDFGTERKGKGTLTDAVGQRIGGVVCPVDHGLGRVLILAGVVHLLGVGAVHSLA